MFYSRLTQIYNYYGYVSFVSDFSKSRYPIIYTIVKQISITEGCYFSTCNNIPLSKVSI